MNNCKYCQLDISSLSISKKANHIRWCDKRPDKKEMNERHSAKLSESANKRWGRLQNFEVVCDTCKSSFNVERRSELFDANDIYHCSRTCANTKGGKAHSEKEGFTGKRSYREIAFRIYECKSCLICGFDKVVEVHHIDHNHDNNVKGNIVILCPNHHMMIHRSKYSNETKAEIQRILGA